MSTCCCLPRLPPPRPVSNQSERVQLNVGGKEFTTSWSTIRKGKGSKLEAMLEFPEADGSYFIDRDGRHFHHILNFLRDGPASFSCPIQPTTRSEVLREAEAYGLAELVEMLNNSEAVETIPKQGALIPAGVSSPERLYVGALRPNNEEERLARLQSLDILYTATDDPKYDNITSTVAAICDVPIVLVSLVSENEQWFKSRCGLDALSTSRNTSFCATMMKPEEPDKAFMLVIEDAERDPRVASNPLVQGPPFIRFYAGCPLITSDGLRLGALCSIDQRARSIAAWQSQVIINFATICVTEMEASQFNSKSKEPDKPSMNRKTGSSGTINGLEETIPAFTHGPLRADQMRQALREAVITCFVRSSGMDWSVFYANRIWTQISGIQVMSPKRLANRAQVRSDSDPGFCSDNLWDWMELQEPGGKDAELIGTIQSELADKTPRPRAFGLNTVSRAPGRNPIQLRCKFTPANMPMDVNSACVQPPFNVGTDLNPPSLFGGSGYFYFVTIAVMPSLQSGSDAGIMGNLGSNGYRASLSGNGDTPGRRSQTGNTLASLNAIKPARSPFSDVRLMSPVGEGSFGKVYFGLWSGSPVAIKVIEQHDSQEEQPFKLVFEASLSASICHPNLVQTYKFSSRRNEKVLGEEMRMYWETWIVQEWCDKGTLGSYFADCAGKPLNMLEAVEELIEIARAGSYLHSRGIIHGDLTGNNVLLRSDVCRKGHICKVCDFGLARILDEEAREVITNTLGTVTHMPPELFLPTADGGCLTPKADVYAAGILLWQALTRKRPFDGLLAPQVVVKVAQGRRPVLPPDIQPDVAQIYHDCTAYDVNARPTFDTALESFSEVMRLL